MNQSVDYYAVIQVDPRAESEVIEAAYRRLAAKYHPDVDRSPGATDRMKLINAAYEVLSDPEKRRMYDIRRASSRVSRSAPGPARRPASRPDFTQWLFNLALTILFLVITAGGARFGPRGLLLVGMLVLLVLLLAAWRKS